MAGKCYLYFIGSIGPDELCKIGVSRSPTSRLASVQTGSHVDLTLHYTVEYSSRHLAMWMERVMHASLDAYKIRSEWFRASPKRAYDLLREIDGIIANSEFDPEDSIAIFQMTAFQFLGLPK